jgi:Tripartite tricarboxylate transporter family receptor
MYARALAAIAIGVLVGFTGLAGAQSFPSKPVKIVVPFGPGGAADVMARVLAESMSKGLGQPVVVENRPGAGAVSTVRLRCTWRCRKFRGSRIPRVLRRQRRIYAFRYTGDPRRFICREHLAGYRGLSS